MLSTDQAPAIARYLAGAPRDAAGLGDAVDWKRSGWPAWALYQPIADAAIRAGLPIIAANVPPAVVRRLPREGVRALDPALVAAHHLDRPLPAERYAELAAAIREAHCGYAREEAIPAMVLVQRARDAQMAAALAAAPGDGAVLIAGVEHVRRDRGVPAYLASRVAGESVLSVALIEVRDDARAPDGYAGGRGTATLPVDYAWFTPRLEDADPCEKFRTSLEKLRERK
jgi:uncharacterized iron-regulated protein